MGIQDVSGLGRHHAALGADQQLLFQLPFQGGQLLAERRLRNMQHLRRLGQAADIDDFHKILQTSEIHIASVMPLNCVDRTAARSGPDRRNKRSR
ncbi:hypothetical protein D3C76_1716760 [compost metagenome]|jgi:hypothetical protein